MHVPCTCFSGTITLSMKTINEVFDAFDYAMYLNSNGYNDPHGSLNSLLCGSSISVEVPDVEWDVFKKRVALEPEKLKALIFSYELKNILERLNSSNTQMFGFPLAGFFIPEYSEITHRNGAIQVEGSFNPGKAEKTMLPQIIKEMCPETSREVYKEKFDRIQFHLKRGDIYEVNLCIRFSGIVTNLNPINLYKRLNNDSPAPFSSLLKWRDAWIVCSSPERYLRKSGNKVISQPIKGTIRRTGNEETDNKSIHLLKKSAKEKAENLMIVDLVRNDLSHFARQDSVKVIETCGIYPFNRVFQMISTVEAELETRIGLADVLETSFPMGSMTGVPKIRAMQIADSIETFCREMYSGSLGYAINTDFDLNVVIRSYLYHKPSGYLAFSTGSAITLQSEAEREYDECLLKAESLHKCLNDILHS
jgi:para-aminobenzoate synthetase component 1